LGITFYLLTLEKRIVRRSTHLEKPLAFKVCRKRTKGQPDNGTTRFTHQFNPLHQQKQTARVWDTRARASLAPTLLRSGLPTPY